MIALLLPLALVLALPRGGDEAEPPSARELLLGLTRSSRLASTAGGWTGAQFCARELERAGWQVEIDAREVLLSLPRKIEFAIHASASESVPLASRLESFDPDALPANDVPPCSAWSASGSVKGPVVDAGYGLRADFERLRDLGLELAGAVALVRYGKCYRGIKVDLAAQFGCSAVLLYNDPAEDGPAHGPTWPAGPWKPDWEAQRGSISPMGRAPGDPSTPGWASPRPGQAGARRLPTAELEAALPRILCLPIGSADAALLQKHLSTSAAGEHIGPGPAQVRLALDQPRTLRTIHNVIARLPGQSERTVIAGGHRDAWVRGANDNGAGCVVILRAARALGERARKGWKPAYTITLGLWDAEELGLIGSTEWGEANGAFLAQNALAYVNFDAGVGGPRFSHASGSPGLLGVLQGVLQRIPAAPRAEGSAPADLWEEWKATREPRLSLPGSGSDFAVFGHHLNVPVLEFGFGGSSGGGQYHTAFDDFAFVERWIDPGFVGHELAARTLTDLLAEMAERGPAAFDAAEAARELAVRAREAGAESPDWLGAQRAERLVQAFEQLAERCAGRERAAGLAFYPQLAARNGVPGRAWFKNRLWAPALENGYGSETFPTLRAAARTDEAALEAELVDLIAAAARLASAR